MNSLSEHADHILLALTLVVTAGVLWRTILLPLHRLMKRTVEFLEDWNGEEPRPGKTSTPGVLARLASIEHEVHENNGSSIKDSVHRIEAKLDEHIRQHGEGLK